MKALRISLFSLLASLLIIACVNPPDYPDAPVIEYIGVNKTTVFQGSANLPADTLAIFFSFTDGDGDLDYEDIAALAFPVIRCVTRFWEF